MQGRSDLSQKMMSFILMLYLWMSCYSDVTPLRQRPNTFLENKEQQNEYFSPLKIVKGQRSYNCILLALFHPFHFSRENNKLTEETLPTDLFNGASIFIYF